MEGTVSQSKPVHQCQAAVVHCIDFRIQKRLHEYLDGRFPESYDQISLAGGIKHLAEDGEEDNFGLQELVISNRLHSPETIVLTQHEDCGAYGGSAAFDGFEDEVEFHRQQAQKAEELLRRHVPDANIEKYLVRLTGELIPLA